MRTGSAVLHELRAGVVCAALPSTCLAQLASGGSGPDVSYVRVVLALLFCLVLGVGVLLILRRRLRVPSSTGDGKAVRIVATARLDMRTLLYVIEFDGRRILVARDAGHIMCLASYLPTPSASGSSPP